MSGLAPKWVRLVQNGTNPGLCSLDFGRRNHHTRVVTRVWNAEWLFGSVLAFNTKGSEFKSRWNHPKKCSIELNFKLILKYL